MRSREAMGLSRSPPQTVVGRDREDTGASGPSHRGDLLPHPRTEGRMTLLPYIGLSVLLWVALDIAVAIWLHQVQRRRG